MNQAVNNLNPIVSVGQVYRFAKEDTYWLTIAKGIGCFRDNWICLNLENGKIQDWDIEGRSNLSHANYTYYTGSERMYLIET